MPAGSSARTGLRKAITQMRRTGGVHLARWLACALAIFPCFAVSPIAAADSFSATSIAEDGGERLVFHWPGGSSGTATVEDRTLTITTAKPIEDDVSHLADVVGALGRFVQLSADKETLTVTLAKAMIASPETTGADFVVHLRSPSATAAEGVTGPPAVRAPQLTVSENDGYTRLRFEFPQPTTYSAALAEGQLTLAFKTDKAVRLTGLRVHPPARVRTATGALAAGTFTATIGVAPGVSLRQSQVDNNIIIDLVDPPLDAATPSTTPPPAATPSTAPQSAGNESAQAAADDDSQAKPPSEAAPQPAAGDTAAAAKPAPPSAAPPAASDQPQKPAAAEPAQSANAAPPGTIESLIKVKDIDVSALDARLHNPAADNGGGADDDLANPVDVAASDAFADASMQDQASAPFAVAVSLDADSIELKFPWGRDVPAAMIRRGERLWIAFGASATIDLSPLDPLRDKGIESYASYVAEGATIVGLQLDEHLLATAIAQPGAWTISLGDSILKTAPDIGLAPRTDGDVAELAAAMPGELKLAHFRDPDVGDDLIFAMEGPNQQGLVSTRQFVDFALPASGQGLVVRPLSDGVDARLEPGGVVITKPGGLALSGTHMPGIAVAKLPKPPKTSPADMKFAAWRGPAKVSFNAGESERMIKVATSKGEDHLQAELDLAHFLISYELPEEALGVLDAMASESPAITSDLHYRALRGVTNLIAGRIDDAAQDLDARLMPDDAESDLWLGMLAARQHDWPKARVLFAKAEPAIDKLDAPWQARARLAAAEAALSVNDVTNARMHLEFLPREGLLPQDAQQAALLDARLAEALGQNGKALAGYEKLANTAIEPIQVQAKLADTRLAAKLGKITVNEAIDKLEALRFQWRGDAIEANTLLTLGRLYAKIGDYRHALTTMRMAVHHFPGSPAERQITQEMYDMFEELYLGGKADQMPPIQALALYYDFKELTPIGPKGDIMIRRLSDRLVAMDLLDQASALLSYQVDNRLRGVAKSQVAARLALIQLMNHKPEDALRTIYNTQQAELPDKIAEQRRLIESRALMDLKRYADALDVISDDTDPVFGRLRADIYWHESDWAKAGPALEEELGSAYSDASPLSDGQRFDVMRASIAYELGGEKDGLARIAAEYMPKMKGTPDEHAFAVVVADPGSANLEFHDLTEKLASIDTLSDFLADLKKEVPEPPAGNGEPVTN